MAILSGNVICARGHTIRFSVEWDPQKAGRYPQHYFEPCPMPGCDGQVVGPLPIGANRKTLELRTGAAHAGSARAGT
jgi:hypothetical protein